MIINSASDIKYFSRLLNLYFSININAKNKYKFKVWDLGMSKIQFFILKKMKIDVINIPNFVPFWNICYTWKPFIYKFANEKTFFYLDAGCTVNKDLNEIYQIIEKDGYFFVGQGQELKDIVPSDFSQFFNLNNFNEKAKVFAAGIIGINKEIPINNYIIDKIYEQAKGGFCLGFSKNEIHRDLNNINIIRDCPTFRHDQSVVNSVFRNYLNHIVVHEEKKYASTTLNTDCVIYNQRKKNYTYFFKYVTVFKLILFFYCFFLDGYIVAKYQFGKLIKQ